jgi:hypothetical protein
MIVGSSLLINPLHIFHYTLAQAQAAPVNGFGATFECLKGTFATNVNGSGLNCATELSKLTAQEWNAIWQAKIGTAGPEFTALMNISRYIAGPAVVLWGISAIRDMYRNGIADGWQRAVAIVILVFVMYSDNAAVMRNSTLAIRSLMNYQNEIVLELTNQDSQYESKLGQMADYRIVEDSITEFRSQCNGKTSNQEFLACLTEADQKAEAIIKEYEAAHPGSRWAQPLKDFLGGIIKNPMNSVSQAVAIGGATVLTGPVGGIATAGVVTTAGSTLIINGILAGMNYLAQNVVELTWLFTAVIVPVPLALSFYPGTKGSLIGWAVGFLMVGLFKINLNIASSLIVSMIYERGPGAGTGDLMILSFGVIFVASLMTAGGGYALFNGIMSGVTAVAMTAVRVTAGVATGGIVK